MCGFWYSPFTREGLETARDFVRMELTKEEGVVDGGVVPVWEERCVCVVTVF